MPVEPTQEQLAEIASLAGDSTEPVLMLNLNRYRPEKGRAAYGRYAQVALRVLDRVGGRVLWQSAAIGTVIGDDSDRYDDVIAVWYPSLAAFLELAGDSELHAARGHRAEGLERAALICCGSE